MLISLNWLKDFIDLPKNLDPKDLAEQLTLKTAEVESVIDSGKGLDDVVVGEIKEIKKHPDADKLSLAKVNIGKKEPLNLIFGQMVKMNIGDRVPVAIAPTTLPTGIKIEKRKMRGELSEGMLCLDQELGFEKEGVKIQYFPDTKPGTPLKEALKLDDVILEFDNKSLTHRPDLWGHFGIAREVAAITKTRFKALNPKPEIPVKGQSLKVDVEDFKLCPRYCGLIIDNIKVTDSPDWLKKRLKAVGHGTHNNIVDVTNYVVAELGQPMHAFDKNYIKGGIIVRRAEKGEKITTLDDKTRSLNQDILVIADHKKPVAIAGIMGGENSEINEKTTSIILESANFNAGSVRRASVELGLRTDAVQRFEKAIDPCLAETAIKRAAELILEICPTAKIAGPITDTRDHSDKTLLLPYPLSINLDPEKAGSKIGADINHKEMARALKRLEFKVDQKGKTWEVGVPSFRATKDVDIEDDLIEEIARMYGYENIPSVLPKLPTKVPEENTQRFKKHRARELLSYGLGFDEVYNYSFYGKAEIKNCLLDRGIHLKLLNFLSEEQTHLRISLIPNLLKSVLENIKHKDEFKLYEIGRTYKETGGYMPLEEKKITGLIVAKGQNDYPFYEAKGVVETFLKRFSLPKTRTAGEITDTPYAHPGKSISYLDPHGQTLAKVFMLHPKVSQSHGLEKYSIGVFALNFSELMKLPEEPRKYKPVPRFPGIEIDISVMIAKTIEIQSLEEAIKKADRDLIASVELFDIYQGDNIAKDKKACAFKITLRALNRTLTDEEMTGVQQKIFQNLEKEGGVIRGK